MTAEEALAKLQKHINPLVEHRPGEPPGLLPSLRPFDGTVRDETLAELESILAALKPKFDGGVVDKELMYELHELGALPRLWGVDEAGMLRRNDLICEADSRRLDDWLACYAEALTALLCGGEVEEAFLVYSDVYRHAERAADAAANVFQVKPPTPVPDWGPPRRELGDLVPPADVVQLTEVMGTHATFFNFIHVWSPSRTDFGSQHIADVRNAVETVRGSHRRRPFRPHETSELKLDLDRCTLIPVANTDNGETFCTTWWKGHPAIIVFPMREEHYWATSMQLLDLLIALKADPMRIPFFPDDLETT